MRAPYVNSLETQYTIENTLEAVNTMRTPRDTAVTPARHPGSPAGTHEGHEQRGAQHREQEAEALEEQQEAHDHQPVQPRVQQEEPAHGYSGRNIELSR